VIATRSSTVPPGATAGLRPIVRSVLAALTVVVPLGVGRAVSPVMLTEQTVLLAGPDGGRAGMRYAAGVVLTTFVIVVAIVLFGRTISLPTEPPLDATLNLVLGLVLVNAAVLVLVSGRRRGGPPTRNGGDDGGASGARQARAAFAFGVFAMATTSRRWPRSHRPPNRSSELTLRSQQRIHALGIPVSAGGRPYVMAFPCGGYADLDITMTSCATASVTPAAISPGCWSR
jgi:hypothetical protein